MPRKTVSKNKINKKKFKDDDSSDQEISSSEGNVSSEDDNSISNTGGASDEDQDISEKSDSSYASDQDDDLVANLSESEENITDEDLTDEETSEESNISDSDISNPRNIIKDEEGCVHDYISSGDEGLDDIDNDKIKLYDQRAIDYFKDYDASKIVGTEDDANYVLGEERITKPFLFDYERIALLSKRTKQLSSGAKSMIKDSIEMPAYTVAELELEHNVIPLIIGRMLPNGKEELWKVGELARIN